MLSKLALASASLLATVLASETTIKALPDYSSLPGYDATTGNAGPWSFTTAGASNETQNDFGLSVYYDIEINPWDPRGSRFINYARLTVNTRVDLARLAFKCENNTLKTLTEIDVDPFDGTLRNVDWTPVVTEWIPDFGGPTHSGPPHPTGFKILQQGDKPVVYEHYVDGVKQNGLFLGGYNTSTWGLTWLEPSKASFNLPSYWARLVMPGTGLGPNETTAYIKIQA